MPTRVRDKRQETRDKRQEKRDKSKKQQEKQNQNVTQRTNIFFSEQHTQDARQQQH